jgi:hypothetical protein
MITDLRKKLKPFYTASAKKPALIDIPALQSLSINGKGAPESELFKHSIEAIYGTVYTLKFGLKKSSKGKLDFNIMPLEGFWTVAHGRRIGEPGPRELWEWKLIIVVPDWVTNDHMQSAVAQLKAKKDNPAIDSIRLERIEEGKVVQMLHVGPYATEPETVATMLAHADAEGYTCAGEHHEIYMSDPRRTAPEKLKTILRHKVQKKAIAAGAN